MTEQSSIKFISVSRITDNQILLTHATDKIKKAYITEFKREAQDIVDGIDPSTVAIQGSFQDTTESIQG